MDIRFSSGIGLVALLVAAAIGIGLMVWYFSAVLTVQEQVLAPGDKGGAGAIDQARRLQDKADKESEQLKRLEEETGPRTPRK